MNIDDINAERPRWITEELEGPQIADIVRYGCSSGVYMPAVTYHTALETMSEHGDDVLQYIEDQLGELPEVPDDSSYSGMACFYLSCAVELWCSQWDQWEVPDETE